MIWTSLNASCWLALIRGRGIWLVTRIAPDTAPRLNLLPLKGRLPQRTPWPNYGTPTTHSVCFDRMPRITTATAIPAIALESTQTAIQGFSTRDATPSVAKTKNQRVKTMPFHPRACLLDRKDLSRQSRRIWSLAAITCSALIQVNATRVWRRAEIKIAIGMLHPEC